MRVLIGCEKSGVVRRAFRALGHDAYSCDLEPAEDGSEFHIQGDVLDWLSGAPITIEWNTDWIYGCGKNDEGHSAVEMKTLADPDKPWDMAIFHPECKFVALCQVWRRHPSRADCELHGLDPKDTVWRMEQRLKAVKFADALWNAKIPRICLEQPKSMLSTLMAPKSQTIHPWQFGHMEQKETWLWLKNLPPLVPTNNVYEAMMKLPKKERERVFHASPGARRSADRSRTYEGIAAAMAEQWGSL